MASMALAFDILARDKGASKTFDQVGRSAESAGRKGEGFGSLMKKGLGVAAGAFAAVGLVDLIGKATATLGTAIDEAREAEKVGKTTAQIIKATGGAAKVSADQVGSLAESISNKTGIDDEAIQSGANLLLTFKRVRNETGKGADIFDRATKAATDLSAAGFGSIEGASKMLGKALNDPVKGISALSRAGVTFTEGQKKQIKTMMEAGDVLGAQKIILGEVESQVGGVAAANATMSEKVKVAWDNFLEKVGTKALPLLDKLGTWFIEDGIPALEKFGAFVSEKVAPALGKIGDWLQEKVIPKLEAFWSWISEKLWPALKDGYDTIMPGVKKALDVISGGVGDGSIKWKELGDAITQKVIPFIAKMTREYLPLWAGQIRTVIETVKTLWRVFETWRGVVATVIGKVNGFFTGMIRVWAKVLDALGNVPGFDWAKDAAAKLRGAASQADAFGDAINRINDKTVTIAVRFTSTGKVVLPNGVTVAMGTYKARAKGGPVTAGGAYAVGDNPDGSWNRTTEVLVPNQNGRVVTQRQAAQEAARMMMQPTSGGGGPLDLSESSLRRLAAILQGAPLQAKISAASVDAALAVGL